MHSRSLSILIEIHFLLTVGRSYQNQFEQRRNDLRLKTDVEFFVNVSNSGADNERDFLFYMGNLEETYKKIPNSYTDDYMAIQVGKIWTCKWNNCQGLIGSWSLAIALIRIRIYHALNFEWFVGSFIKNRIARIGIRKSILCAIFFILGLLNFTLYTWQSVYSIVLN